MPKPKLPPIDLALARRVLRVVNKGLCTGVGEPFPGNMCVEAAVCYALGIKHGDSPPCVHPIISSVKIGLNDGYYGTNEQRAELLKRVAVAQLGSNKIRESSLLIALNREYVNRLAPAILEFDADDNDKEDDFRELATFCCYAKSPAAVRRAVNRLHRSYFGCAYGNVVDSIEWAASELEGYGAEGYRAAANCVEDALRACKCEGVKLLDQIYARRKEGRPRKETRKAK